MAKFYAAYFNVVAKERNREVLESTLYDILVFKTESERDSWCNYTDEISVEAGMSRKEDGLRLPVSRGTVKALLKQYDGRVREEKSPAAKDARCLIFPFYCVQMVKHWEKE